MIIGEQFVCPRPPYNDVKDFGAVGDGVHDDTEAIEAAMKYFRKSGLKYISFPPGHYKISEGQSFRIGVVEK